MKQLRYGIVGHQSEPRAFVCGVVTVRGNGLANRRAGEALAAAKFSGEAFALELGIVGTDEVTWAEDAFADLMITLAPPVPGRNEAIRAMRNASDNHVCVIEYQG